MKLLSIAVVAGITGIWLTTMWVVPVVPPAIDPPPPRPPTLPEAARRAVNELFPAGSIAAIGLERRILQFYEVTVLLEGREREVTVMADGTILEIGEDIDPALAPDTLKDHCGALPAGHQLEAIERIQVHAELKAVTLAEPRTEYELDYRTAGQLREVRLADAAPPGPHVGTDNRRESGGVAIGRLIPGARPPSPP